MKKGIGFFGKLKNWRFVVSLAPLVIVLFIVTLAEANRDFASWLWQKVDAAVIREWMIRWDLWICENDVKQTKATERD